MKKVEKEKVFAEKLNGRLAMLGIIKKSKDSHKTDTPCLTKLNICYIVLLQFLTKHK